MTMERPNDTQPTTPAAALRRLRTMHGWTLKDVSRRTGLAISTLSKLENGHLNLTYDKLASITSGLDVDVAQVLKPGLQPQVNVVAGRRSITRKGDGVLMRSDSYDHLFIAADLLSKQFTPIIGEIRARSRTESSCFATPAKNSSTCSRGAMEMYTDVYAPLTLEAGDSSISTVLCGMLFWPRRRRRAASFRSALPSKATIRFTWENGSVGSLLLIWRAADGMMRS